MKKVLIFVLAALLMMAAGCSPATAEKQQNAMTAGSTAADSKSTSGAQNTPATPAVTPKATTDNGRHVNRFTLSVSLDDRNHTLSVKQSLIYRNNTGKDLKEIYFNIIPQAFLDKGGGTDVKSVSAGGEACRFREVNGTVYTLGLPKTLPAAGTLDLEMEYTVKIPPLQDRFGYQDSVYNLGNFIITPAVYTKTGWSKETYVSIGDPFYTDIADYSVSIHVPAGYTVAATGEDSGNGVYIAENVRDFVFCAGNSFKTLSDRCEGTAITVYYDGIHQETAQRALDASKKSLMLFSEDFGKYPYRTLDVVLNKLTVGGGMEYPELVMISVSRYLEEIDSSYGPGFYHAFADGLDDVICHEIAHQWFYGIVGNNQVTEPWLDEGFSCFAEYIYQEAYPPEKPGASPVKDTLVYNYNRIMNKEDSVANLKESLYDWEKNDPEGYVGIYYKGAALLYGMEQQMGRDAFMAALKEYVAKFSYGFTDTESFKAFWNSKEDFSKLFRAFF